MTEPYQGSFTADGFSALVLRVNGADRWSVNSAGHFIAVTDNSFDIGASGASRPRNLFLSGRANIGTLTVGLGGQTSVATNTALGFEVLNSASLTGGGNTGVGYQALYTNTTGTSNSALGIFALYENTTGASNAAFGRSALLSNTTGSNSSALGLDALRRFVSTGNNTAVGYRALYGGDATLANNTGANNIAIGYQAGDAITTGSTNIAIGYDVDVDSPTASNQINVGGVYFHDRLLYTERDDPAAPAANQAVVYARDNGSGKTQLCVRFTTGAVQVLATEP